MITGKRIHTLARTLAAMLLAIALAACSESMHPAASVQTLDSATPSSNAADPGTGLAEIVVTATRLPSPRVAKETSLRPPAKRGG